jgi:FkbM family methyltransferase
MNEVQMVAAKLNGKYNLILPKHRADRPEWYTEQGWERARIDSLHDHLTDKDVLYYVGAEEGDIAALCQKFGATVVLFEPNPKVWSNIKAIWLANNLKTPITFAGFASNSTERKDEPIREGFPACADDEIIGNHGFKELYLESATYPQIKIDDVWSPGIFKPPTAITLDVEGSEWQVLRGAEDTIKKYRPKIWLSGHPEFMFHQWGEHLGDLRRWIREFGYKEELLDYQHEVHLFYRPL